MPNCPQCGEPTSVFNRDLFSGVCNQCRRAEAEKERLRQETAHETRETVREAGESARTVDQLIFVGLNGYALALARDTGQIVWVNSQMRSGYVTLLLDGDRLIVSTNGYIYCLDPLTGQVLWNNPLRGYGMGAPTSLISERGQSLQTLIHQAAAAEAAKRRAHPPHTAG